MTYDKNWAIEKREKSEQLDFLFFWGHQPSEDGSTTKSCFSQWWVAPFTVDGQIYKTAEHWMMAAKAKLFNDDSIALKILDAESPAEVKKLGRLVNGFDPIVWEVHKYDIVVKGNQYKFSQHPALKSFLIATESKIIVEASPVDNIWGIGMAASDSGVYDPQKWKGENLLGFALMEVRDKLRNNE
jgi:ribA/ribD-fused uncharacterized protein